MDQKQIRFQWTGSFKYQDGAWCYADRSAWRVGPRNHRNLCRFTKNLRGVWDMLLTALGQPQHSAPDEHQVLKWFGDDPNATVPVRDTLSIMLNHVVLSSIVKPFRITFTVVGPNLTAELDAPVLGQPIWYYWRHRPKSVDGVPPPFWLDNLGEYLLSMPRLFFGRSSPDHHLKVDHAAVKETAEWLRAHRVLHKYSVVSCRQDVERNSLVIQLRDEVVLEQYHKGRACNCIPIPGKPKRIAGKGELCVRSPEVVVTSPNVVETLESLSRIWQDRFARSVLISAPPGSGKENFANSIPFGNGRPTKSFMSLSLASGTTESLERQLYGHTRADGSIEPGLLAKTSKSALFLDEAHYPEAEPGLRASLLRTLESGEYYPAGSSSPQRVDDVLFIFATSKRIRKQEPEASGVRLLGQVPPVDFWTRMTHLVEIKHPLEVATNGDVKTILSDFYSFLWWERIEEFYKVDPTHVDVSDHEASDLVLQRQMRSLIEQAEHAGLRIDFADEVLKVLRDHQPAALAPSDLSIRGLRSIVSRLFSIAVADISAGRAAWKDHDFKQELSQVAREVLEIARLDAAGTTGAAERVHRQSVLLTVVPPSMRIGADAADSDDAMPLQELK